MGIRLKHPQRLAWAALALWLFTGAAGAWAAYGVATRPGNAHATRVTLMPKAGDYGPVYVSVALIPVARPDGVLSQAIVNVSPHDGVGGFVTLPDRTWSAANPHAASQPAEEPLSAEALSRWFPATADAAALRELVSAVDAAGDGNLPTRFEHFVTIDARPWAPVWSGRAGRQRVMVMAGGVTLWFVVAGALVRAAGANGDVVSPSI
jgi:hypothetical protein